MKTDVVMRAMTRAASSLRGVQVVESLLARHDAGEPQAGDAQLAGAVVDELLSHREPDGSWLGSLTRTAELLHDIDELRAIDPANSDSAATSVEWLLSRQNGDGRFGGVCTPRLHLLQLCEHAVSGFFAPAPMDVNLSTLTLQHGARFVSDTAARIGASSLALSAVLRFGVSGPEVSRHLDALRRVTELDDRDRASLVSSAALACMALALQAAPAAEPARAALPEMIGALLRTQRGDGSWPDTDLFFVLSVLTQLARDPACAPLLQASMDRAARLLVLLQQPDGSWGRQGEAWRQLVGWRVLRRATSAAPGSSIEA